MSEVNANFLRALLIIYRFVSDSGNIYAYTSDCRKGMKGCWVTISALFD